MALKQVILVRMDLKMPKGKLAVQAAHASVDATLKSDKRLVEEWKEEGMRKVALKVNSEHELRRFQRLAEESGLKTSLITDAGKTFFDKPTTTCLGIGPDDEGRIDALTGKLKMV